MGLFQSYFPLEENLYSNLIEEVRDEKEEDRQFLSKVFEAKKKPKSNSDGNRLVMRTEER